MDNTLGSPWSSHERLSPGFPNIYPLVSQKGPIPHLSYILEKEKLLQAAQGSGQWSKQDWVPSELHLIPRKHQELPKSLQLMWQWWWLRSQRVPVLSAWWGVTWTTWTPDTLIWRHLGGFLTSEKMWRSSLGRTQSTPLVSNLPHSAQEAEIFLGDPCLYKCQGSQEKNNSNYKNKLAIMQMCRGVATCDTCRRCWGWCPDPGLRSTGIIPPWPHDSPFLLIALTPQRILDFPAWLHMERGLGRRKGPIHDPKHHPHVLPCWRVWGTWLRPWACQLVRMSRPTISGGQHARNQLGRWPQPGPTCREQLSDPGSSQSPKKTHLHPQHLPSSADLPAQQHLCSMNYPGLPLCLRLRPAKLQGMLNSALHLLS